MTAGEEGGSELGVPMGPPPPEPWVPSFTADSQKICIWSPSLPGLIWAAPLPVPGVMLGQNTSFGRAGLGTGAGKERQETRLVCQRWGGPKAGASLLSCHHPPRYSTCRAPRLPAFTRTGGSSLAERPLPSRFVGSSTSHELPAAPTRL